MRWLAALLAFGFAAAPAAAFAQQPTVLVVRIEGVITPVVADVLTDAVAEAERGHHQALLVELDTPGGLDTSMRQIIQRFLGADVPVIVYVTPAGGRAASAGALITIAAHLAVMTPGTTIGASTPVNAETGEKASDKVINDAAAYAESIAVQRGRNKDFAIATVREGRAVSAEEAVTVDAVDFLARDRDEVLSTVHLRQVRLASGRTVTMNTVGAKTVEFDFGLLRRLLQIIADPNLAFLFLSIGTLAVVYEAASPGMGLSGVIGVILLILGFYALSVLPVNVAGIALLVLAGALFAAEVIHPGVAVFAVGGAIALALAGVFLFQGEGMGVSPAVFVPTAAVVGLGALFAGRLAWKARRSPPISGESTLTGQEATVSRMDGDVGMVFVEGAWWRARGPDLLVGQRVRVVGRDGLTLRVEGVADG
ncbi:MAG TPA: nodulation protein NfeD [Candidatus Limnocylindrales bacterium]|nr:nodulation protein NfeD [Candidatus Limnocylindrales bacterium]